MRFLQFRHYSLNFSLYYVPFNIFQTVDYPLFNFFFRLYHTSRQVVSSKEGLIQWLTDKHLNRKARLLVSTFESSARRDRGSRESVYSVSELINTWRVMFQKIALFVGIILIVIAAVLLIGNFSSDNTSVVLGLLGIFVIGVFFLSKKKKWLVSNKWIMLQ